MNRKSILNQNALKVIVFMATWMIIVGCSQSDGSLTSKLAPGGEVINGHVLPPEPDPAINNATLLGIDSNDNGVRDDVERWIFQTYEHPIVQAVAMQNARAFQIILVEPSKARVTVKFMHDQTDCEGYYKYQDPEKLIPRGQSLYSESRPIILNTRERSRAYYEYNQALSGGVYAGSDLNTLKSKCDFNETQILHGEWE